MALHLQSDDGETQHLVVTLEQRIRSSPRYRLALAEDRPDVIVTVHNSASTRGNPEPNRMGYEVVNASGNAEPRRGGGRCPAARPATCASVIFAAIGDVLRRAQGRESASASGLGVARSPMTYETCATSRSCVVRRIATARPAEHASTAQFNLPDGPCINVSLPRERLERLRQAGPVEMTVTGEVYRDPSAAGEDVVLEIEGRTIGFGLCGDFFVFVPDSQ